MRAPALKGGGLVRGFTPKKPHSFVAVRENLFLWRFSCASPKVCKKQVNRHTKQKKDLADFVGTWYLVRTSKTCGRLSVLDNFSGDGKAEKAGAFVNWRQTKPSNVLNKDISQPFPEGQLLRNCTLGMVPFSKKGHRCEGTRGKYDFLVTLAIKLSPSIPASRTTTWSWIRHRALARHNTYGRGRCSVELQRQFHGVAAAVRWSTLDILKSLRMIFGLL